MTSGVTVAMLFNNGVIPKEGIQPGEIRSPYIKEKLYTTSSSPNEVQSDEEAQKIIGSITKYGLSAGAMYLIKRALENQKIQKRVREYSNFGYLAESVSGTKDDALRIFGGGRVTLTNLLMNTARMAEELSPFHILRTFQVSHILQPFATRESEHFFDSDALAAQKNYFREMFKMHGERELTTSDFANGITYRSGQMLDSEGNVILKDARLVASEFTGINRLHDESSAYNRILSRFVARAGVSKNAEQEVFNLGKNIAEGAPPLTFIASSGNESSEFKWAKTVVGQAVAQGFNTVNEPVAFVEEMTGTLINKENRIFQFLKKYGKINPNAHQNAELGELALGYIKHGATKLGALGLGYYVLDNASKVFGSDGSGYDKGILEGLSASAVNAKIKYNEVVSDNFKEYVAEQEYMAPGSTSLLRLAGFPLAGAMAAGTYAYAERALPSFLSGTYKEGVRNAVQQSNVISGAVSDAVDHTILNSSIGRVTRTKQFAMRGALVGALLTLPFLPGALMGESSEDAKAEYYEGKDVAIKRNRFWFSGSGDIEGEGVKYFTKNWFNRLQAGNRDKILYGDGDTKESLNPFLHPFDYLRNPYRFEEMHKHDMPYPVWGMDVSVGGWAGKIFEKTIGQVIKPDIINPEMYKISGNNIEQGQEYDPNSIPESGDLGLYNSGDIQAGNYFQIAEQYTSKFKSLIDDNLATGKVNPRYDPVSEGFNYTFNAVQDFIGLKGWAMSGITSSLGVGDTDHSNQIARSGEATNFAREFQSWNLGGLFGGADVLRRIVPMSTEVTYDRVNPLSNQVSTTWLPNGNSNYTDFSKGAFWDKVENGYDRLPGAGYETYNPSLKGVNPEDYPDINKFEILSDVAYGSKEYFAMNKKMSDLYQSGEMEEQDRAKFDEIYIQNQERARQKVFHEYKTDDDVEGISLWGRALGTIWETTTHNAELPTERLSFFRPAGKLLHQRTAVEDYQHTQLSGSDTALWNRPYDHFIRPFFSDVNKYFNPDSIPDHVQEKRNVDNYFDALEYYKQMKLYRENYYTNTGLANQARRNAGRTLYGAVASGLDSQQDVEAAYSALSDNERAYFSSFVNAKGDDRARISAMVDGANESQMYKMLWERKDALENGENIHALLEQEESDLIKSHAAAYKGYQSSGDSRIGISFREYLQEKRAEEVISDATGIPDENFVGWDPRIEVNDIKLRTLQVSKADVKEYGYWKQDEQALSQNLAVLKETQVTTKLKSISNISARRDFNNYLAIKDTLHQQGIRTKDVIFSNTGFGDTDINIG